MLNTDLPESTWQHDAFHGALLHINATDAMLGAFVQIVEPSAEQRTALLERSNEFAAAADPLNNTDVRGEVAQRALIMAFREFYQAVNGEALVREYAPEVAAQVDGQRTPRDESKRGPGRPPKDPEATEAARLERARMLAGPQLTGEVRSDLLAGHDQELAILLDRQQIGDAIHREMTEFAARLSAMTSFFDDLQLGDTLVRTWSTAELSTLLGVSSATLLNWRQRGTGPKFVVTGTRGDAVRYPVFRVVEWLTS